MQRKLFYYFLVFSIALFGCKKGNPFGNTGPVVTVERPASAISQIILNNHINLFLTQGNAEKILVEAPKEIEPYITTSFSGASLTIGNSNVGILNNPDEVVNVYVSVKDLARIDYHGSGNINCTNTIQKDYFTIETTEGSGNISLNLNTIFTLAKLDNDVADFIFSGQSDSCYTYCSTIGTIDYRNFKVKRLQLDQGSVRDAYVWATETLNARIFFKGNVFYKGNPTTVQTQNSGTGKFFTF